MITLRRGSHADEIVLWIALAALAVFMAFFAWFVLVR